MSKIRVLPFENGQSFCRINLDVPLMSARGMAQRRTAERPASENRRRARSPRAIGNDGDRTSGSTRAALRRAGKIPAQRRLCGGEARDQHAERRARDVVQPDLVAEGDRGRIAAVLAADAELQVLAHLAAT